MAKNKQKTKNNKNINFTISKKLLYIIIGIIALCGVSVAGFFVINNLQKDPPEHIYKVGETINNNDVEIIINKIEKVESSNSYVICYKVVASLKNSSKEKINVSDYFSRSLFDVNFNDDSIEENYLPLCPVSQEQFSWFSTNSNDYLGVNNETKNKAINISIDKEKNKDRKIDYLIYDKKFKIALPE